MQRLYDSDMRLIGYLAEGAAGRLSVLDADRNVLGYYYPSSGKTYTKDMELVGRGNQLAALLERERMQSAPPQ